MKKLLSGLAGISLLTVSSLAMAVPMSGGVSFSSFDTSQFNWDSENDLFDFAVDNASVDGVSGDFIGVLNVGDLANFSDFYYNSNFVPGTIWESGPLSFSLNSITVAQELAISPGQSPFGALIGGVGTLSDGVDSTSGTWNISVNTAGNTFSWSSSTQPEAANVPEPASLALFALGAFGLVARRKFKA